MKVFLSIALAIAVICCMILGFITLGFKSDADTLQGQLRDVQNELAGTRNELANTQSELASVQADLDNTEQGLSAAADKLASTESQLQETSLDLSEVSAQLVSVVEESAAAYANYLSLREQVYQKLGLGESRELTITPRSPAVAALSKQIAGTLSPDWDEFWRDYKKMYDWVLNNIEYSSDTNLPILPEDPGDALLWMSEYWKLPEETIEDMRGDCEDMSSLLASLLLSYNNEQYSVWMVAIHGNQGDGHIAVASPVQGDRLVIFDPAGRYYSGSPGGVTTTYSISTAVNQWLMHWSVEIPGAEVTAVFSNDFYLEFDYTEEFIAWAENRH